MKHRKDASDSLPDAASSSIFILAELRGGPHDGQTMRIPADQMQVEVNHHGRRLVYQRFNDAPVLRYSRDIEQMLGGGRKR